MRLEDTSSCCWDSRRAREGTRGGSTSWGSVEGCGWRPASGGVGARGALRPRPGLSGGADRRADGRVGDDGSAILLPQAAQPGEFVVAQGLVALGEIVQRVVEPVFLMFGGRFQD